MKGFTLIFALMIAASQVFAGMSKKTENEIYNEGVDLLMELEFKKAEKKFRKVIKDKPNFAEAHNNLAYCLRKQGSDYYEEAMTHYNKAVQLKPEAPEPYMYRGVLFVSMGETDKALQDHQKVLDLGATELAGELEYVVSNKKEKTPEQFFGVFEKVEVKE
jgi:Flp pilus assembly protein TadD